MKRNLVKMGIFLGLVCLMAGFVSAGIGQGSQYQQMYYPSNTVMVDGGSAFIQGPPSNPTITASAKNQNIQVAHGGSNIQIVLSYSMNCPGAADDGCCKIQLIGSTTENEAWTGDVSNGKISIPTFAYPNDVISWKITAIYYDFWKTVVVGQATDIGLGHTIYFQNDYMEQAISTGQIICVQ